MSTAGKARGLADRRTLEARPGAGSCRTERAWLAPPLLVLLVLVAGPAWVESAAAEGGLDARLAEARQLIKELRFAEAEKLSREFLAESLKAHGPDSIETARALDLVVESLWRSGRSAGTDARELAERAVSVKEEVAADDPIDVATSRRNLAIVLEDTGHPEEARALHEQVLAARREALGPEHVQVAWSLTDIANLLFNTAEFETAKPFYEQALAIQEKTLGPTDPEVARTLNNLAVLHQQLGEFEAAESCLRRALAIREAMQPGDPLAVAWTLNSLAALQEERGRYPAARDLFERTLRIREEALGSRHTHVAWALINLGNLARQEGGYQAARGYYERALGILQETLGPDHLDVAALQSNLGELLFLMGDDRAAETLYGKALESRESGLGPDHPAVGGILLKLATLRLRQGNYPSARLLLERCLGIYASSFGEDHAEYATGLKDLAKVAQAEQGAAAAMLLYKRALSIQEAALGPDHPAVGQTLTDLGRLLLQEGSPTEAAALGQRALKIRERFLGRQHPLVAEDLEILGLAHAIAGDLASALDEGLRAEKLTRDHLRLTARTLTEREALHYAATRVSGTSLALSIALHTGEAAAQARAWDSLIRSRALVLDEMAARNVALSRSDDPEVADLAEDLHAATRRLSNLLLQGPDPAVPGGYSAQVDIARHDHEVAARALAKRSLPFRRDEQRAQVGLESVRRGLPRGSALVAFALYDRVPVGGAGGREAVPTYLAFVLQDGPGAPRPVDLGTAADIDRLVSDWRSALYDSLPAATDPAAPSARRLRAAGEALRRRVWDPVASRLPEAGRVFIVPDGSLTLVSFAGLTITSERYLIDEGWMIHYLSAERDLVTSPVAEGGRGLLAIGGPSFDQAEPTKPPSASPGPEPDTRHRASCGDFRTMRFGGLPGSASEAERIVAFLSEVTPPAGEAGVLLTGPRATEAAFKRAAEGKRVIHIATHGFFLGKSCGADLRTVRGVGGLAPARTLQETMENPLVLSGLALAGANQRDTRGPDQEDGILTAEEIAAMNLRGVEWAVLSACDTGLGAVESGEGVLGLRRAFQMAGARSVIMSLWAAEEEATSEWMDALYEGRYRRRLGTAAAAHEASLAVLHSRRENGRTTHPFYWAGFVATGDWR